MGMTIAEKIIAAAAGVDSVKPGDICAMRHPKEGAPLVASMASNIPVINAGDGGHQHPTCLFYGGWIPKRFCGRSGCHRMYPDLHSHNFFCSEGQ